MKRYAFAFFILALALFSNQFPSLYAQEERPAKRLNDFSIPDSCNQLIIATSPDWNSSNATLRLWRRNSKGHWEAASSSWPGRLGRSGMAWGRGISQMSSGRIKKTGDGCTPAGVFELGDAYGYASSCSTKLAYHQVTEKDLWVEDFASPHYNAHSVTPHGGAPRNEWEKKQQMKQNDHAHSLKLFIRHNAPPDASDGMGCSLFFHIWRRNGQLPSSGCIVMPEENLRSMLQWLDPDQKPLLVALPQSIYKSKKRAWGLP